MQWRYCRCRYSGGIVGVGTVEVLSHTSFLDGCDGRQMVCSFLGTCQRSFVRVTSESAITGDSTVTAVSI